MKEQPRHKKAFEYYVGLDKRSYLKVAEKFTVSETSIKKWAKAFGWRERIKGRDKKISTELAKRTDEVLLKTKVEYRIEVQQNLKLLRAALALIAGKIKNKMFKAETATDLSTLIKAYDLAVRLEQLLAGDVDSRQAIVVNLLPCDPEPRAKPVESEVVDGN